MRRTALPSLSLLLFVVLSRVEAASSPWLELTFNETGETLKNTGNERDISATMFDSQNQPAELHSADALGVSGKAGDRAFDNQSSTTMGFRRSDQGGSAGGRVELEGVREVISQARSLTLTCWIKASEQRLGANARLVDLAFQPKGKTERETGSGLSLRAAGDQNSGRLAFELFEKQGSDFAQFYKSTDANTLKEVDEWIFLAMVYDGTTSVGPSVAIYRADRDSSPRLIASAGEQQGMLAVLAQAKSSLGNVPGGTMAPFQGLMDDVRVYVSDKDGSGALSPELLEKIRRADLDNLVPEL